MHTVDAKRAERIIRGALAAEGADGKVAAAVARGLTETSLRGVDSHGIRLVHHYLEALKSGRINPKPRFKVERRMAACAVLDADHTFGHAAGYEAARLAVEMAAEHGAGNVAVKNSSHFGAAACFALEIARKGMIGTSYTHADSLIIPTGGKRKFLGNNPVCFTAPVAGEDPFCLDMATSSITFNEVRRLRDTGGRAPEGVGTDENGVVTTDPQRISMLLPVGGHKGYGLSAMVEVLCAMLTGMPFGPHITPMFATLEGRRRLGHFVGAMNIAAFCDPEEFKARMKQMLDELRAEPALDPDNPVMVAGDPEKRKFARRSAEGIPVTADELAAFEALEKKYGLAREAA